MSSVSSLYSLADTIVAIATPHGQGGIGIVRLSGNNSAAILQALVRSRKGTPLPAFLPRVMTHGWVHALANGSGTNGASGDALDEVLAVYMAAPATATGEDTAEIHCHGSPAVLREVLQAAASAGARIAERGEFTYRAFANGKLDLTQAEAVAEMIAAPSRQGVRLAGAKLAGLLGQRINGLREQVERLRAMAILAIDFPDEEADYFDPSAVLQGIAQVRQGLQELLAGYGRARQWQEGVPVSLAGRVNVGKSSLLNALLGRERAIVSSVPGTTRDVIEEGLDLDGLLVRLADTAGLRESHDPVEQEGMTRSLALAEQASLVLLVTIAGEPLSAEDRDVLLRHAGKVLLVRNKIDVPGAAEREQALSSEAPGVPVAHISAQSGEGLEVLAASLRALALAGEGGAEPRSGDLAPNLRQSYLLASALKEADALAEALPGGLPCDLISVRLDGMAAYLGEITGFAASDDILGQVFSRFCIGK